MWNCQIKIGCCDFGSFSCHTNCNHTGRYNFYWNCQKTPKNTFFGVPFLGVFLQYVWKWLISGVHSWGDFQKHCFFTILKNGNCVTFVIWTMVHKGTPYQIEIWGSRNMSKSHWQRPKKWSIYNLKFWWSKSDRFLELSSLQTSILSCPKWGFWIFLMIKIEKSDIFIVLSPSRNIFLPFFEPK